MNSKLFGKKKNFNLKCIWTAAVIANVALVQSSAMADDRETYEALGTANLALIVAMAPTEGFLGAQKQFLREESGDLKKRLSSMKRNGSSLGEIAEQERRIQSVDQRLAVNAERRTLGRVVLGAPLLASTTYLLGHDVGKYISDRSIKRAAEQQVTSGDHDHSNSGAQAAAAN